ncbi:thioredoxin [Natronomonas salina]|uniref:thioredoxin n=1 Tax=Natronomonas salina TaxID=1710540 RepID=UPI0015B757E1|nr:thioredoxin [Natronomonas salina]QLD89640.1 thioredoxin [Natronomonas salina]
MAAEPIPTEPIRIDGEEALEDLTKERELVLADFYADWCGPCQMLEPRLETIAADTEATVAKVDVDANQALASSYGVRGVPTLVLFVDGEPTERLVGLQSEDDLRGVIDART